MSNEESVQEALLTRIKADNPTPVTEGGIPDSRTIKVDTSGKIVPYISLQFGDIDDAGEMSFAGYRSADYNLPIYAQAVAASPREARRLMNRFKDKLLGLDFPWTGEVRKRAGGGVFNDTASNGATEAYVSAASFTVTIQYE